MKVWSVIFNMFALVVMGFMSIAYLNITRVCNRDFNTLRLNKAIEYAAKETFTEALAVEDLGVDYEDMGNININTGQSLDVFETMMCINYDMSVSYENKKYIENSIVAIVLSGNDGFYITQSVEDDTTPNNGVPGGEYVLRWSPKIPYLYSLNGSTFALNIGKGAYAWVDGTGKLIIPEDPDYPIDLTKEDALIAANNQIKKAIVTEAENKDSNNNQFEYNVNLPVQTINTGVNPIDGPGILVLMSGNRFASAEPIDAMGVSGYKTTKKVNVIAFTEMVNGVERKYYCYQGQMSPHDINNVYNVKNYYRTIADAAKDGYSPHYGLLSRKIALE